MAWKPVAKVQVQSADDVTILWNALAVTELGIDKDSLLGKTLVNLEPEKVEWSL